MLLLTFIEHSGTQSRHLSSNAYDIQMNGGQATTHQRTVAFITNLDLNSALRRLVAYEAAYKARYRLYAEFRLIGCAEIQRILPEVASECHELLFIEDLPQKPEDFQ